MAGALPERVFLDCAPQTGGELRLCRWMASTAGVRQGDRAGIGPRIGELRGPGGRAGYGLRDMHKVYFRLALGIGFLPAAMAAAEASGRPDGVAPMRMAEDVAAPAATADRPGSAAPEALKTDGRSARPDEEPDCD